MRGVQLRAAWSLVLLVWSSVLAGPAATPVADAASRGDHEAVRSLLKEGADVNTAQGDGTTALHWAAMRGDVPLAEMLLVAGANVKATTRLGGYTPLLLAARAGEAAMVAVLANAGADVKDATVTGVTAVMLAAASGRAAAVRALVERGADVNAKERSMQQTALMFAAAANRVEAVSELLAQGADASSATRELDLSTFSREVEDEVRRFRQQGGAGPAEERRQKPAPSAQAAPAPPPSRKAQMPGVDRQYFYNELVGRAGGLAPLHFAARQGHADAVAALLAGGADIDQRTADQTTPLLIAIVNGHFDLARDLVEKGADVKAASDNGVTPLYAVLNVQWAPKALYPQPRAHLQQTLRYLDLAQLLIERGADVNARLKKKVWYSGYNFDLSGVDEIGATPFWRAAYASDVDAMKLLVAHGADPSLRTLKPAGRPRTGDGGRESTKDVSGLPPVPVGGPGVTPLQAAAGVGYGEGFAANSHRFAPGGMMAAVRYLVEEIRVDVNEVDHEGNTALHHAAARGDNEMIEYLVSRGANVRAVNREGNNVADMANGPVQRIEPFTQTLALLEKLGVKHRNKCVSC